MTDEQVEAVRAALDRIAADLEKAAQERGTSVALVAAEVIHTYVRGASAGFMRAKPM